MNDIIANKELLVDTSSRSNVNSIQLDDGCKIVLKDQADADEAMDSTTSNDNEASATVTATTTTTTTTNPTETTESDAASTTTTAPTNEANQSETVTSTINNPAESTSVNLVPSESGNEVIMKDEQQPVSEQSIEPEPVSTTAGKHLSFSFKYQAHRIDSI